MDTDVSIKMWIDADSLVVVDECGGGNYPAIDFYPRGEDGMCRLSFRGNREMLRMLLEQALEGLE